MRDADAVFDDLSTQTQEELSTAGLDVSAQKSRAQRYIGKGKAYVSENEDGPLTLFGFEDHSDYLSMWSVATPRFYDLGADGVRVTRRFFLNMDIDVPLVVVTASPHPEVGRWLRLIGFELGERNGPIQVFTRRPKYCS